MHYFPNAPPIFQIHMLCKLEFRLIESFVGNNILHILSTVLQLAVYLNRTSFVFFVFTRTVNNVVFFHTFFSNKSSKFNRRFISYYSVKAFDKEGQLF